MDGKHENSKMNSKVNKNECKQSNGEFSGEDQQRALYDQLRVWVQKKGELKKNRTRRSMQSSEGSVIMHYLTELI